MHYSSEDLHKSRNESKDEEDDEDTDRLDVVGFDDSNISSPGKFMIIGKLDLYVNKCVSSVIRCYTIICDDKMKQDDT